MLNLHCFSSLGRGFTAALCAATGVSGTDGRRTSEYAQPQPYQIMAPKLRTRLIITKGVLCLTVLTALSARPQSAIAYEATRGWGTIATAGPETASAVMHHQESQTAQIEYIGRDVTTMYRSNYSCGTCINYTIEGDRNQINDNSITSTNSGSVTANGSFK